jgi:8-oxo-dGTP diphosphatase
VTTSARETTEVAVGVLVRADGAALMGDRPAGKPYAGHWEFPGGKIEPGETVQQALARELHEELGIDIDVALPWFVHEYDYPHAYVRLHFRRVLRWRGEPHPREGQRLGFFRPDGDWPTPCLPAAAPALRGLKVPPLYAFTGVAALGLERFLAALDVQLARGLRQLQLREPALEPAEVDAAFRAILPRCRAHGARVLVSSRHAARWADRCDGVHLTSADLASTAVRPDCGWLAASAHTREDLLRAARLGCDFVVAGPVLPTVSHPGQPVLGWHGFEMLMRDTPLPCFALGGLDTMDLDCAQQAGAHGVALLSGAWRG